MSTIVQKYLSGAIALDPTFVRLREQVFDSEKSWIRLEDAILSPGTQKLGPISMRTLSAALGWELRPWTKEFSLDEARLTEFFRSFNALNSWEMGLLNCLSEEETVQIRKVLTRLGNKVFEFPFPIRILSEPRSYKQYLEMRGARTNKNQRRYLKGLTAAGFEFRREFSWNDIENVLDSRKAEFDNGADYSKTPQFRRFFKAFVEELLATKRLLGAGIFQADKMVGYTLGFCNGPVYHCYQTAFDPAFKDYRPGALTIEKSIEHALDGGVEVIDFMNDSAYLEAYTKEILPLKRVVFFSGSLKGRLMASLFAFRNRQ